MNPIKRVFETNWFSTCTSFIGCPCSLLISNSIDVPVIFIDKYDKVSEENTLKYFVVAGTRKEFNAEGKFVKQKIDKQMNLVEKENVFVPNKPGDVDTMMHSVGGRCTW